MDELESQIRALGPLSSLVLRIGPKLEPGCDDICLSRLETLQNQLAQDVFFLDWILEPVLGSAGGLAQLPEGVFRRVDEALIAILQGRTPEGHGQAFASEDAQIVREAQILLHRLAQRPTP